MLWILTAVSLVGVVMNVKKMRACFYLWCVTNFCWCVYDLSIGAYAQAALFLAYFLLAVWGILEWRDEKK